MNELDDAVLTALLERAGPACPELDALLEADGDVAAHAATCPVCAADPVLRSMLHGPVDAGDLASVVARLEVSGAVVRPRPRQSWMALAVAAVVLIGIGIGLRPVSPMLPDPPETSVVRGADLVLKSPLGRIDAMPKRFVWHGVEGAVRYRVVLARPDGTEVWSTEVDTVEVAAGVELLPGARHRWQVSALDVEGRVVARSAFADVTVVP